MKRAALVTIVVLSTMPLWAQDAPLPLTPEEFASLVDFGTSLEELNAAIETGRLDEYQDRIIVVDGTVASAMVYSPDPNDFYAEVELVGGRWIGLDAVDINRAYIVMMGPEFAERVPERPPREPVPGQIVRNSEIIVAGTIYDVTPDDQGRLVPLIVAYDARTR